MLARSLPHGSMAALGSAAVLIAIGACGAPSAASIAPQAPGAPAATEQPAARGAQDGSASAPSSSIPAALQNAPHESFTISSRKMGEVRRINLYTPPGYAESPTARYPVLYLLDGGDAEDFPTPHILATVDAAIRAKEMQPIIVVGIENTERRRDMTGPTTVPADLAIARQVGGSATFRAFLRDELTSLIAQRVRTSGRAALMGESAAGLFVVETFFLAPDMFDTYVAISPRVSWNDSSLVRGAEAWLRAHSQLRATLYLGGAGDDDIDDQRAKLGQILAAHAPAGLTWFYEPRPDLLHANIYETVSPSVLRRLFPPSGPTEPRR
jgi:predicted alpha/beta superfamily hydrolase